MKNKVIIWGRNEYHIGVTLEKIAEMDISLLDKIHLPEEIFS